jgi:3'-phosphoadenosine 5'-phosphosulfate sulfotransferase (PAPS reductase)/FAD synthetase
MIEIWKPVLSYGGGVNSTALAILAVNEGWRGHIVFSDTGTEWPDTYCFMDLFERDWLAPRGLHIERLGAEWRHKGRREHLIDYCERARVVPMGMRRWCTIEYKIKPLQAWCAARGLSNDVDVMLGIAADESWRMMSACRPLVDRGIDRDGCVRIIQAEGLPVPRKSGCYICPFQKDSQWRELWTRNPDLFTRAERMEENARRRRTSRRGGKPLVLDIAGKVTLAQRRVTYESQLTLPEVDMDELMEYRPCMCSL